MIKTMKILLNNEHDIFSMCGTPSTCYHQRRAQPNKRELPWRKSSQSTMIIFKWVVIIDIASIIIIIIIIIISTIAIFTIIVFTKLTPTA